MTSAEPEIPWRGLPSKQYPGRMKRFCCKLTLVVLKMRYFFEWLTLKFQCKDTKEYILRLCWLDKTRVKIRLSYLKFKILTPVLSQWQKAVSFCTEEIFCSFITTVNLFRAGIRVTELWQVHDTQYNDTQHNDTQHNDIKHNDTQTVGLFATLSIKDTKYNDI